MNPICKGLVFSIAVVTAVAGQPLALAMDLVGNRLSRISTLPGVSNQTDLTYNPRDQFDSDTFDANGNTLFTTVETFQGPLPTLADQYDSRNMLVQRANENGLITLIYDGDGNRVGKIIHPADPLAPARTTWYLVDSLNPTGYAQVVEELEGPTSLADLGTVPLTVTATYTYGHDLISIDQNVGDFLTPDWQTRFYLYDGLGTVVGLADTTGTETERYTYDAYGLTLREEIWIPTTSTWQPATLNPSLATRNPYRYTGERYDADLSLYYQRARYLNPDFGTFWNLDTYEGRHTDPLTLHKYLYVHGNPVMGVDPSGNATLLGQMATVLLMPTRTTNVFLVRFAIGWTFGHLSLLYTEKYIKRPAEALREIEQSIRKERPRLSLAAGVLAENFEKKIPGRVLQNVALPFVNQLGGFVSGLLFAKTALEIRDAAGAVDEFTKLVYTMCGKSRGEIDFIALGRSIVTFSFDANRLIYDSVNIAEVVADRDPMKTMRACDSFTEYFGRFLK